MLGSQALETAIGLTLVLFVLSSLASAIVEGVSRLLRKRSKDLEETIGQMLSGSPTFDKDAQNALERFKDTTIYQSATIAASRGRRLFRTTAGPAYLSAKSFANAIDELTDQATEAPVRGLNARLAMLKADRQGLSVEKKAAIESWYDETMSRLSGAYKRWATGVLFAVSLVMAVAGNVSIFHLAQLLWQQPSIRQAALNAAEQAAAKSTSPDDLIDDSVKAVQDVAGIGMPVGWQSGTHWDNPMWATSHVAGWLATALLLMLGAPFWFDALSRVVSLRATGAKPPSAAKDSAAATSLHASAGASGASASVMASTVATALGAVAEHGGRHGTAPSAPALGAGPSAASDDAPGNHPAGSD
ncbi:hypothetical protein FHR83_008063 [Actinoplanes campanulatus]|uniref:Uncharacterized protein n=1 Tax=Actinoplanes campanulatus TaxID=113559 RepID=A0A7W5AQ83_9ACTN|nr:hypothetical protein [Actinoplanes campanulatus]MBB3100341.1 hypothetical protein [Actinoplanes campanulatus]GGN43791.1 hypothetical protein GCM10010109_76290 [Actinoplanes campanulatus]GID40857.1 hypothetical protein Aca09nite_73630 [Actinoplanes campanulatus]